VCLLCASGCGSEAATPDSSSSTVEGGASEVVVVAPPGYELQFTEVETTVRASLLARCDVTETSEHSVATVWVFPADPSAGQFEELSDVEVDPTAIVLGEREGLPSAQIGDLYLEAQQWTDGLPNISLGALGAAIEGALTEGGTVDLGSGLSVDCSRVAEGAEGEAVIAVVYQFRPVSDEDLPGVRAIVRPRETEPILGAEGAPTSVSIKRGDSVVEFHPVPAEASVPAQFGSAIRDVTPGEEAELWRSGSLGALLDVSLARGVAFELTESPTGGLGVSAVDGRHRRGIGTIDDNGEGWTPTDVPIAGLGGLTWVFAPSPTSVESCSLELSSGVVVDGDVEALDLQADETRIYACTAAVRVPDVVRAQMNRPAAAPIEIDLLDADEG
jgi:hypothetical protein